MSDTPMVERKARIFRFGHYPDKRWGITREQFVAANGEKGSIPIGFDPVRRGHYVGLSSALDGKTGRADWYVVGDEIHTDIKWPPFVDEAATELGLKFSTVWPGPEFSKLGQVDLVERSHIPDAVLFAADGSEALVVFEDDEPSCTCKDELAQSMHDLAADARPGLCDGTHDHQGESDDDRAFRQMHDFAVHEGAYCPGMPDGPPEDDEEAIAMSEKIEKDDGQPGEEPQAVTFTAEQFREMQDEIKRLQEGRLRDREEVIKERAVVFADSVTRGDNQKAYPAERQHLIDQYARAAMDDARMPEAITFSDGKATKQGTRLEALKAAIDVRPRITVKDPKVAVEFSALAEEPTPDKSAQDKELDEIDASTRKWAAGMNGSRK